MKGRERGRSLIFLPDMNKEDQIQAVAALLENLLQEDPEYFIVDISIRPVHNIRVFLDADTGVVIEKCVGYNRKLYRAIVESGLFPDGEFSLEVSSPGLEEPLKMHRQYVKNLGRMVEVTPVEGPVMTGIMTGVLADSISLTEEKGKGKKKEVTEHVILFQNRKSTKIQIVI